MRTSSSRATSLSRATLPQAPRHVTTHNTHQSHPTASRITSNGFLVGTDKFSTSSICLSWRGGLEAANVPVAFLVTVIRLQYLRTHRRSLRLWHTYLQRLLISAILCLLGRGVSLCPGRGLYETTGISRARCYSKQHGQLRRYLLSAPLCTPTASNDDGAEIPA